MGNKIILDYVSNVEPKKDDVLTFNEKLQKWVATPKAKFMAEQDLKYKVLSKRCDDLDNKINQLNEKIIALAKLKKEGK